MNKPRELVNKVITRFDYLGVLTFRSMFGGYGICQEKVMFAIVSGDKFYLRANDELESIFIELGMEPLIYMNRGLPILMRYYHVNQSIWGNEKKLNDLTEAALKAAIEDKDWKENHNNDRLKALPNITLSLERLLWRAGIFAKQALFEMGAVNAFLRIREISSRVSTEVLFSLAGAIEGCHVAALSEDIKKRLLKEVELAY